MVLLIMRPAAVIHVDLDGAADIYPAHGWAWPHASDPLFASGLRGVLDLLEERGLQATLFAIARSLDDPRKRELLQEAVRRGHAIGSHSVTHRRLTRLPPAEQRRELLDSRTRLQDLLGTEVGGFRAPGFASDAGLLSRVEEAGYRYDSSLFAGQRLDGGSPRERVSAAPGPLRPGRPLLEIPLPRHRPLPLPFHPSYSLVLGEWYFRLGLRARGRAAPFLLLLHLTDLADPLPDQYLTGWSSRLYTLSHLSAASKRRRCRAMLDAVGRTHDWTTTERLLIAASEPAPA